MFLELVEQESDEVVIINVEHILMVKPVDDDVTAIVFSGSERITVRCPFPVVRDFLITQRHEGKAGQ